ncbi:hypothetical protein [Bacillus sp. 1NLA3E]|uniref:hypothetical protein n=1 Tax=Bacillus sp. 1NLA3E TaxID=666686 RepID=UPI000247E3DB|nr:hypothetical protein [Bacillus sp. 1NLA3E]
MGLFRDIGKGIGTGLGVVVGGPIAIAGELTGVKILENIGDGVMKASSCAGETAGRLTEGTINTVNGIWNDDPIKRDEGLSDIGYAVETTAKGVYHTAKNALQNGGEIIGGAIDGDIDMVKKGASGLVTTVAVGALAIGVLDFVDGVDGADGAEMSTVDSDVAVDVVDNQNPSIHTVDPNYVDGYYRADGTYVEGYWRDGDGNTTVDRSVEQGGGYERSNPDGNPTNNLG